MSPITWHEALLERAATPDFCVQLAKQAQTLAREFLDQEHAPAQPRTIAQANAWYASSEGQACLSSIARTAWQRMTKASRHAMPAHDARHAMFKVPAAALAHMRAEAVQGYERIGVLGALLHDYGRWAEERIFGGPGEGVLHARLSFLLSRELLAAYDMPALVRRQLLLAPLRHTTGAVPADPMPLKLTVSADRDQLYGPEIVLRLAHHGLDGSGSLSSFYGEKQGLTVLTKLKHFHDNRLMGPLFVLEPNVLRLQSELRTFLLLSEDFKSSASRWTEQAAQASSRAALSPFAPADWARSWDECQGLALTVAPSACAHQALQRLLNAPHLAPNPAHKAVALAKVSDVPAELDARLTKALDWAHQCRIEADAVEHVELLEIQAQYKEDSLVATVTELLLDNWNA